MFEIPNQGCVKCHNSSCTNLPRQGKYLLSATLLIGRFGQEDAWRFRIKGSHTSCSIHSFRIRTNSSSLIGWRTNINNTLIQSRNLWTSSWESCEISRGHSSVEKTVKKAEYQWKFKNRDIPLSNWEPLHTFKFLKLNTIQQHHFQQQINDKSLNVALHWYSFFKKNKTFLLFLFLSLFEKAKAFLCMSLIQQMEPTTFLHRLLYFFKLKHNSQGKLQGNNFWSSTLAHCQKLSQYG